MRTLHLNVVLIAAALTAAPLDAQDAALRERGVQLYEQGRYTEARTALSGYVRGNPNDARAAFYLGMTHRRERNVDAAVASLERAVRLDERSSRYHLELAASLGEKAQGANVARQGILARRAKSHLDRAVQLDPENLDARFGLVQFYLIAPGVMGGSAEKARAQADEIRRRNAYRGAMAVGMVHLRAKNHAAAEAEYRGALRQHPDSAALYYALGAVYAETKQWDRLFETIEARISRAPDDAAAHYQLGRAGAVSGQRLDRAESALRTYLRTPAKASQPSHAAAHWRLGMIHEHRGQREAARQEYQTALRLDPQHREAQAALAKLK